MDLDALKKKLQSINRANRLQGVQLASSLDDKSPDRVLPEMERFIPGEVLTSENGECFATDEWSPGDDLFGQFELKNLAEVDAITLSNLFALNPPVKSSGRIIYLDTETTGLSGGTGTYAFMVGLGWWDSNGFRVRQYFMRDYEEEPGQMDQVARELKDCSLVVTYNGGPFDLPLLKTRLIFNRHRSVLEGLPHLDLLPIARRLWRAKYRAANLSHLEREVLGNERSDDVPGSMIPHIYFQFVRGASPRSMRPVFYHNRMDLLALAGLTYRAMRCHQGVEQVSDEWEALGVARFLITTKRESEALPYLQLLYEKSENERNWLLGCQMLGLVLRRLDQRAKAAEVWESVRRSPYFCPVCYLELAKYFEHSCRDYSQARAVVLEIFDFYQQPPEPAADDPDSRLEVAYDYANGDRLAQDELPTICYDDETASAATNSVTQLPPPPFERLAEDLRHRLARLERLIKHPRS